MTGKQKATLMGYCIGRLESRSIEMTEDKINKIIDHILKDESLMYIETQNELEFYSVYFDWYGNYLVSL